MQFQKQYLNFEFKKAQSSLKEIVQLRLLKDWDEVERKIFSTSYLRLAQMDELYRHQWVDRFLAFNKNFFIDEDIFPSSFISWVKESHQGYQVSTHLWYGQNIPQNVKTIIINGEVFDRLGFSRRIDPNIKYRVTLVRSLSGINKGSHFVLVLSGRDLMNYSFEILDPQLKIEEAQIKSFSEDVKPKVISSDVAQKQILSNEPLSYESKDIVQNNDFFERKVKFEDTAFDNKDLQSLSSVNMMQKDFKKQPSSPSFFKKHKWFIIIFSSITVGLVISYGLNQSLSRRQKRQRVTHREDIHY